MRDFNFFEPYIKVVSKPNRMQYLWVVLVALLLVLMGGYQIILLGQLALEKSALNSINAYIQNTEVQNQLIEVQEKEALESALTETLVLLSQVTFEVEEMNALTDVTIDAINAQVPENTFLTSLSLTQGRLVLQGYSTQYAAIAQLGFNLRQTSYFDDIQIPSIVEKEGQYLFEIQATWVKEGSQ